MTEIASGTPFAPRPPSMACPPEKIAPDTWLIHHVQSALVAPLNVYLNSVVITGAEPVIVDTGAPANRAQWLEDVFSIVEPDDVRWVFLSHDDVDHTGNLAEVMDRCPNATLACSWALLERHTNAFDFPLPRCRWVNDGDQLDVGDRTLQVIRPPVYDSPTTRGLYDPKSGVYWAVDCFATPMPGGVVSSVADLDPGFWNEGHTMFMHHALAPWLSLVDPSRFADATRRIQSIGMTTIATAHSPVVPQSHVGQAFDMVCALPTTPPPPLPDQAMLDQVLAAMNG
jgi:flavorubredoxin